MTMPATKFRAGFTLVEMMLVLFVSMLLMTMVMPVFRVSTRAVQTIERKLAVYEAARNILDVIEIEIQQAALNERGEHFSLKRVTFTDTDPFTPSAVTRFFGSKREAGSINYLKHQPGGLNYNSSTPYRGGMPFALCYSTSAGTINEGYLGSVNSTLLYNVTDQTAKLADVSQIECKPHANPKNEPPYYTTDPVTHVSTGHLGDEPDDWSAPGHEVNAPKYIECGGSSYYQFDITPIKTIDIVFAYWDATTSTWNDVPDGSAIYFAPPPKAVRVTILVCDFQKRATGIFSRVVALPCGWGNGVVTDSRDGVLTDPSTPLYNRTKDLKKIDPAIFGTAGP